MGDTRFATALQIVITVATNEAAGVRTTSPAIATALNTNASFVRKIVAALSKAGVLSSSGGVTGGARLGRPARSICLLDIHRAALPEAKLWTVRPDLGSKDAVSRNIEAISEELGARADQAVAHILAETTVQDCLDQIAELERSRLASSM